MRRQFQWRRWRAALVALAGGGVIFGLAAANGHAWKMVWLPAVMLGAAWPYEPNGRLRSCLRPLWRHEKRA